MKKYCSYSMVLVLLLISSSMAMANDVYIAQTATGAGDGTSCSSARAVSFFNAVGNWGAGTDKIGPGTTVHLCGTFNALAGSNYLTFLASGTVGNPITLKWEDGAIVQSPYFSQGTYGSGGGISANGKSYIIIDGGTNGILRNTANGSGLTYKQGSTAIEIINCNNCEVKNLNISNIYVRTIGDTVMDHGTLNFINASGSNILIHHNSMHDAGWGVNWFYSNGNHDIRVYNNTIYNIDHGFSVFGNGATSDNAYFYNNHVYDYSNWDYTGYHHDGIHAFGLNGAVLKNFWIYNNIFGGNTGTTMTGHIFLEGNGDSTPWTDYTGTARIFNNVFIANSVVNGIVQIYRGKNNEIYNNTIIGGGQSGSTCLATSDTINIAVKNNFIGGCGTLISAFGKATPSMASLDYNVYANCSGFGCWWVGNTETGSWATYRAGQTNYDIHSINQTSSATGGLSSSGVPIAGSSIIDAGTNLSNFGYMSLNSDIVGVSRPQGSTWDIGAYEFTTTKSPNPPSVINIK